MKRSTLPVYVLFAFATWGVWQLWWPAYFLFLFPPTVMEVTAWHFVLASVVSVGVAALWALFVRWVSKPGLSGPGGGRRVLGTALVAFLAFMVPAIRFLWLMYQDAASRVSG